MFFEKNSNYNILNFSNKKIIKKLDFINNLKKNSLTFTLFFKNSSYSILNSKKYLFKNNLNFLVLKIGVYNSSFDERMYLKFMNTLIERSVDLIVLDKLSIFSNYLSNKKNHINFYKIYAKLIVKQIKFFLQRITKTNFEKLNFLTKKKIYQFLNINFLKHNNLILNYFFFNLISQKNTYLFFKNNYLNFFFSSNYNYEKNIYFYLLKKYYFNKKYLFLIKPLFLINKNKYFFHNYNLTNNNQIFTSLFKIFFYNFKNNNKFIINLIDQNFLFSYNYKSFYFSSFIFYKIKNIINYDFSSIKKENFFDLTNFFFSNNIANFDYFSKLDIFSKKFLNSKNKVIDDDTKRSTKLLLGSSLFLSLNHFDFVYIFKFFYYFKFNFFFNKLNLSFYSYTLPKQFKNNEFFFKKTIDLNFSNSVLKKFNKRILSQPFISTFKNNYFGVDFFIDFFFIQNLFINISTINFNFHNDVEVKDFFSSEFQKIKIYIKNFYLLNNFSNNDKFFIFLNKNKKILNENLNKEKMNLKIFWKKFYLKEKYKNFKYNYIVKLNYLKFINSFQQRYLILMKKTNFLYKTNNKYKYKLKKKLLKNYSFFSLNKFIDFQIYFDFLFKKYFDLNIINFKSFFSKKKDLNYYITEFLKNYIFSFLFKYRTNFSRYFFMLKSFLNFFFFNNFLYFFNISKDPEFKSFSNFKFIFKNLNLLSFNKNYLNNLFLLKKNNYFFFIKNYFNKKLNEINFSYLFNNFLNKKLLNILKFNNFLFNYKNNQNSLNFYKISLNRNIKNFKNTISINILLFEKNLFYLNKFFYSSFKYLFFFKIKFNNNFLKNLTSKFLFYKHFNLLKNKLKIVNYNLFNNDFLFQPNFQQKTFKNSNIFFLKIFEFLKVLYFKISKKIYFPSVFFQFKSILNNINNLNFNSKSSLIYSIHLIKMKFHLKFFKKLLLNFILKKNKYLKFLFTKMFFIYNFKNKNLVFNNFKIISTNKKLNFSFIDFKFINKLNTSFFLNSFVLYFNNLNLFFYKFFLFPQFQFFKDFFLLLNFQNFKNSSTIINFQKNFLNFLKIPYDLLTKRHQKKKNLLWVNVKITKRNIYVNLNYNIKKPSLYVYTAGQTSYQGKLKKSKEAVILIGRRLWKRVVINSRKKFNDSLFFKFEKINILFSNFNLLKKLKNTKNNYYFTFLKSTLLNFKKILNFKNTEKFKLKNLILKYKLNFFIVKNKLNLLNYSKKNIKCFFNNLIYNVNKHYYYKLLKNVKKLNFNNKKQKKIYLILLTKSLKKKKKKKLFFLNLGEKKKLKIIKKNLIFKKKNLYLKKNLSKLFFFKYKFFFNSKFNRFLFFNRRRRPLYFIKKRRRVRSLYLSYFNYINYKIKIYFKLKKFLFFFKFNNKINNDFQKNIFKYFSFKNLQSRYKFLKLNIKNLNVNDRLKFFLISEKYLKNKSFFKFILHFKNLTKNFIFKFLKNKRFLNLKTKNNSIILNNNKLNKMRINLFLKNFLFFKNKFLLKKNYFSSLIFKIKLLKKKLYFSNHLKFTNNYLTLNLLKIKLKLLKKKMFIFLNNLRLSKKLSINRFFKVKNIFKKILALFDYLFLLSNFLNYYFLKKNKNLFIFFKKLIIYFFKNLKKNNIFYIFITLFFFYKPRNLLFKFIEFFRYFKHFFFNVKNYFLILKKKYIKIKKFKNIFFFKYFLILKKKSLIFNIKKKLNVTYKDKVNFNNFFILEKNYFKINFFKKIYKRLLLKLNFNFEYYYFIKKFYYIIKISAFNSILLKSKKIQKKVFFYNFKIFLAFKFKNLINKLFLIKKKKFFSSTYKKKLFFILDSFKRIKRIKNKKNNINSLLLSNSTYSYPFFFFSNLQKKKINFFEILNFFDNKKYIFYYQKNSIFQKFIKNVMIVFLKRKININFYNKNKIRFLFCNSFENKYVSNKLLKYLNIKKKLKKKIYKKKVKKKYFFNLKPKYISSKKYINICSNKFKINFIFFMINFYKYFFLIFNKKKIFNNFSTSSRFNNILLHTDSSYFNNFEIKCLFLNKNSLNLFKQKLYLKKKVNSYKQDYKKLNQLKVSFKNFLCFKNLKNKFVYIKNNFNFFTLKKNNITINLIIFLKFFKKYLKNNFYYKQNYNIFSNLNNLKTKLKHYIIKKKDKIKYFYKRWKKNYFIKKNFDSLFFVPKKGYLIIKVEQKNKIVRSLIKGFIKQARGRRLFKRLRPRILKLKKFCFTRSKKPKARRK